MWWNFIIVHPWVWWCYVSKDTKICSLAQLCPGNIHWKFKFVNGSSSLSQMRSRLKLRQKPVVYSNTRAEWPMQLVVVSLHVFAMHAGRLPTRTRIPCVNTAGQGATPVSASDSGCVHMPGPTLARIVLMDKKYRSTCMMRLTFAIFKQIHGEDFCYFYTYWAEIMHVFKKLFWQYWKCRMLSKHKNHTDKMS